MVNEIGFVELRRYLGLDKSPRAFQKSPDPKDTESALAEIDPAPIAPSRFPVEYLFKSRICVPFRGVINLVVGSYEPITSAPAGIVPARQKEVGQIDANKKESEFLVLFFYPFFILRL